MSQPFRCPLSLFPCRATLLVVLAPVLLCGPARAATEAPGPDPLGDPLTLTSPQALAVGGASRATGGDLTNIQAAPAVLALNAVYDVHIAGLAAPSGVLAAQASAVDSRTGPFALGLTYRYAHDSDLALDTSELPGWRAPEEDLVNPSAAHIVAAGGAITNEKRTLALGVGGEYWWRLADVGGAGSGWRVVADVAARPHPVVTVSAGGSLPFLVDGARHARGMTWLDGGLRLQPHPAIGFVGDVVVPTDWQGVSFGVGMEARLAEHLPVRGGWYRSYDADMDAFTGGLSIEGDPASLDYALRWDARGGGEGGQAFWNTLGVRVSF